MAKSAELAGVAHNIAHHASSGLSYLSPHLANALRAVGQTTTEINLLAEKPYPPNAAEVEPLRLALLTLRETCKGLLVKHGFTCSDLQSLTLFATPAPWDKAGYSLHARTVIVSRKGRSYDSGWLQ